MTSEIVINTLAAVLISHASVSALVIGGRITDTLSYIAGFWRAENARRINRVSESPHRANVTMMPILATHALIPGTIIFITMFASFFTLDQYDPFIALNGEQSVLMAALLFGASVATSVHAFVMSPRARAGRMWRYGVARISQIACLLAIIAIFATTKGSLAVTLSSVFILSLLKSTVSITLHGFALHGVFSAVWLPFALMACAGRVFSIGILGPIAFFAPNWLLGLPATKPFGLSVSRQSAVARGTAEIPRNFASDSILAAAAPI